MTSQDFDNFRLTLLNRSGDLCWKMGQKIENDVRSQDNIPLWKKDFYVLYVLNRYIDVMLEYRLYYITDTDTNFFNRATMIEFQSKINAILNMNWNLDFILTD